MAPGIEPSSPSRSSLLLSVLRGIVFSCLRLYRRAWTWFHHKFDQPKPIIDKQEGAQEQNQPEAESSSTRDSYSSADATPKSNPTEESAAKHNYTQNAVWALKAIRDRIKRCVNWIDSKGPLMTTIATIAIAVLTGIYVHYSRAQWRVMSDQLGEMKQTTEATKKAAAAAESAAKTAASQLELAERPWIQITNVRMNSKTVGVMFFDPKQLGGLGPLQVSTSIRISLRNIGHNVAKVDVIPELYLERYSADSEYWNRIKAEKRRFCSSLSKMSDAEQQYIIFPNEQPVEANPSIQAPLRQDAIHPLTRNVFKPPTVETGKGEYVSPVAIICVNYRFQDAKTVYQTSALYTLLNKRTDNSFDFRVGEFTPARDVTVDHFALYDDAY